MWYKNDVTVFDFDESIIKSITKNFMYFGTELESHDKISEVSPKNLSNKKPILN